MHLQFLGILSSSFGSKILWNMIFFFLKKLFNQISIIKFRTVNHFLVYYLLWIIDGHKSFKKLIFIQGSWWKKNDVFYQKYRVPVTPLTFYKETKPFGFQVFLFCHGGGGNKLVKKIIIPLFNNEPSLSYWKQNSLWLYFPQGGKEKDSSI